MQPRRGFTISSAPGVGQVLRALAAAVPLGGRILEIGTGSGVGTAWLVDGLGTRDDAEVVSVEVEAELVAAVRELGWPPHVRLVAGDVLELFADLGTFDLIVADAQGGKWRGLDRTIAALRPGGVLVVDDMTVGPAAPAELAWNQATVRDALASHPALAVAEIKWSTGIVLAVRRREYPPGS